MSIITERLDALRTPLIICCFSADVVIERWSVEVPSDDRVYAYSDYIAHEMTELISAYRQNSRIKMSWIDTGSYNFPFDTGNFEKEVKGNYTDNDEKTRVYYKRYIDDQIGEFLQKISYYKDWLSYYNAFVERGVIKNFDLEYLESAIVEEILGSSKNYTRKGLVDLFARELTFFVNNLERLENILDRFDRIFSNSAVDSQQGGAVVKLQWKGDKTDLAELVWALSKSGCIADTSTGKDVTQKELAGQVATLLSLDSLDIANLMKGRYGTNTKPTSYKAQDGKTFINELQKYLDSRVSD